MTTRRTGTGSLMTRYVVGGISEDGDSLHPRPVEVVAT
jgi:hypothetical protein